MLQSLVIQNYALISELNITFKSGFSVITGETGAGKSILLGAIGLLLGQRADTKVLKQGASKCIVEAEFNLKACHLEEFFNENELEYEDGICVIRREITSTGKSRSFINDSPVQLTQLKAIGSLLLDVHSQHQNLLLADEDFQLQAIDIIANHAPLLQQFKDAFTQYNHILHQLQQAKQMAQRGKDEEEYLRFQLQQLEALGLSEGRQEEMELEQQQLEHAEEIQHTLYELDTRFQGDGNEYEGIISGLVAAERSLSSLTDLLPATSELSERLSSALIDIQDLASDLSRYADRVEVNPQKLEEVNAWLSELYTVMQKHHVQTEAELITLKADFQQQFAAIEHSDENIADLERQLQQQSQQLKTLGEQLTKNRQVAARNIEQQMVSYLVPLGIPNVQFKVEITPRTEPNVTGYDQVDFLFSANKNVPLQSISKVASGGEIARVMLSLKAMISGAVSLPTIIFDEIDTGVSGHIAEQMAKMMRIMGNQNRQVISITHLPQIAALGEHHYRVYKEDDDEGTTSHIVPLSSEERVTEIAHMLSGATLTPAAIANAQSLLAQS